MSGISKNGQRDFHDCRKYSKTANEISTITKISGQMSSFENYRLYQKTAPSRVNGLSKPQASLLHVVCACNYIRLPLTRQHKPSVFVSRFTPSRRFLKYTTSSKIAISRLYKHKMGKSRVLHLLNSAKTSVGGVLS